MKLTRRQGMLSLLTTVTAAALVLSGCSKAEDSASSATTTSAAASSSAAVSSAKSSAADSSAAKSSAAGSAANGSQVVQSGAAGPECTIADYGVQPFDLKSATVGFSQSEKEDNPFRIAETQSIKDEAAKLGITLQTTNAQSDLTKQISDIQDLLNQGVKLLIVAPLNSDGLEPAFQAAKDKGVPVITIDRKVTLDACKDYVSFLGSNFVQQGQRRR